MIDKSSPRYLFLDLLAAIDRLCCEQPENPLVEDLLYKSKLFMHTLQAQSALSDTRQVKDDDHRAHLWNQGLRQYVGPCSTDEERLVTVRAAHDRRQIGLPIRLMK